MRLNFFQHQAVPICLRHPCITTVTLRVQNTPSGVLTSIDFRGIYPVGLCMWGQLVPPGRRPAAGGLNGSQAPEAEQDCLVDSSGSPATLGWHLTPTWFQSTLPGLNRMPGASPLPSDGPEQPRSSLPPWVSCLVLTSTWKPGGRGRGWGGVSNVCVQTHIGFCFPSGCLFQSLELDKIHLIYQFAHMLNLLPSDRLTKFSFKCSVLRV